MPRTRSIRIGILVASTLIAAASLVYILRPNGASTCTVVLIDTAGIRCGDLLFRNGNGVESRVVTGMSNGEYSHIAIAHKGPEGWRAIHAVPGETENARDTDYLKTEPIEEFYKKDRARSGAIATVNCSDEAALTALRYALGKVAQKVAFDHSYSLEDTTELYCTELIYRAYLQAGIDLADNRRHELPMPGTEGCFIFPSDILKSKHMLSVKQLQTTHITNF